MLGQWWRSKTQPSSSDDALHISILARRLRVSKLCQYLLINPKPDFLLCSKQCGLLIEAMGRVASWLSQWERKILPPPFVQDMLTLAMRGVRLLEEFKRLNPSTWLVMAAFKLDSRDEFLELFQGFLQNLIGYVEVLHGPLSHVSTYGIAPPSSLSLQSVASAGIHEACIREAMSLIMNLEKDLYRLPLESAEDRRALKQRLQQGSFAEGEESRIARLLVERLEDTGKENKPFQLDSLDFIDGNPKLLGKGSFGEVYEATWMGLTVAVKQFHGQASLDAELNALLKTSHVNVMRAIAYCRKKGSRKSCLLMERMQGDLDEFVCELEAAKAELPMSISIDILLQIASGMAHLHDKKVMHRDLKPSNVLFKRWPPMSTQHLQGGPADFTAKITDFGEARTQIYETTFATAKRGTACYRAPETLYAIDDNGRAHYSNKADVFSFGMVCYKLLTRSDPCLSGEKVLKGDWSELKFPPDLPWAFIYLMKRCWARAHHRRPSFVEIRDFLSLFKSIVLNTIPASSGRPPLYLGIRDDVLGKLGAFLGKEWLLEEAISLGIGPKFVKIKNRIEIDETFLRLQVTNKLTASPEAVYFSWLRRCLGEPI